MTQNPTVNHDAAGRYFQQREQLAGQFQGQRHPFALLKGLTRLTDRLIAELAVAIAPAPGFAYCLIATGGYGRGELYPHSDIDLLLLYEGSATQAEPLAHLLLTTLWDMKLRPAAACRTLSETLAAAEADHTIFTALLDIRFVCGSRRLFDRLEKLLDEQRRERPRLAFVQAKLQERQRRMEKFGNSRYLLEPNVKENVGGLCDLHMLYWVARIYYGAAQVSDLVRLDILSAEEYRAFRRAHEFLARVRIQLHLLNRRAGEQLTFEHQQQLGRWLGYREGHAHQPVERFMKRYFRIAQEVSQLTRLICTDIEDSRADQSRTLLIRWLRRDRLRGDFIVRGKRLLLAPQLDIAQHPMRMLDYFSLTQEESLAVDGRAMRQMRRHRRTLSTLRQTAEANQRWLSILLSPHKPDLSLSRMNEIGLLGAFIPEFEHVVGQIQYDRYHIYTVDEHIIRIIGELNAIECGARKEELPLGSEIIHQIEARRALFVAAFCHDIAKGKGGNHEQLGVAITQRIARRLGLANDEIQLAAWLVAQQSLFSRTAFSRDLSDPQTIIDFTFAVQSPERLKCLLLLTIVDIRCVGPHIWNGWKGTLLRDLYCKATMEMGTPLPISHETLIAGRRTQLATQLSDWSDADKAVILAEPSAAFWLGMPQEYHRHSADLLRYFAQHDVSVAHHFEIRPFEAITHIQCCLRDQIGLLNAIAGSITRIGGVILSIRSVTLHNEMVMMLLEIQDKQQQAYEDRAQLVALADTIAGALANPAALREAVNARRRRRSHSAIPIAAEVYLHNHLSAQCSVIEISCADRTGLLYDITGTLQALGLNILSTQITTYGDKAVDVFYVTRKDGYKLTDPEEMHSIRAQLLTMLELYSA